MKWKAHDKRYKMTRTKSNSLLIAVALHDITHQATHHVYGKRKKDKIA